MTGPHLTDEQLSERLDGATARAEVPDPLPGSGPDHLVGCVACRQRLEALAGARDLVRTPVAPVSESLRAAAVADVLRSVDETVAPRSVRTGVGSSWALRRPRVLAGAAAVVVVLAGAVAIPLALSHSTTTSDRSATGTSRSHASSRPGVTPTPQQGLSGPGSAQAPVAPGATGTATGEGSSSGSPPAGPTAVPGSAAVPGTTGAPGSATGVPPTAEGAPLTPGAGAPAAAPGLGTSISRGAVALGPVRSIGALRSRVPSIERPGTRATTSARSAFQACVARAAAAAGGGRAPERLATATVGRTPALVYLFGASGAPDPRSPVVVATAKRGCRVLGTVRALTPAGKG